ncbi:MAG TPA: hypothetical protein VF584_01965 [Longimicrobium sp.]|jgi:hypothetical protein
MSSSPADPVPIPAIARHIESGRAEARVAGDDEVAAFWGKAVVAYADARLASASLDARLVRAYDAGRIAATAIVRAGGYRPRGGEGHHFVTFDLAGALVTDPALRTALDAMNGLRTHRHALEYEPEDDVDRAVVDEAVNAATIIINAGADHLRALRPGARARFKKVRPPRE